MIRAIDSRYFQLSISPESHEAHARLFEVRPYGFRFREPAGISLRPPSRNACSENRTRTLPGITGTRKDEFRNGSTLRRHPGSGISRTASARSPERKRFRAAARRYISRGNSCVYFLQNRKKKKKKNRKIRHGHPVRTRLTTASGAWLGSRSREHAAPGARCTRHDVERVETIGSVPITVQYRPGIGILGNTEGHRITIRTHGNYTKYHRDTKELQRPKRYVVPSSRRSLCTCLLPA